VVDADLAHGVVDRVAQIFEGGLGFLVEDAVQRAGVLAEPLLGPGSDDGIAWHQGHGQVRQGRQVKTGAQRVELVLGWLAQRAQVGREGHDLHHAATVLDQL